MLDGQWWQDHNTKCVDCCRKVALKSWCNVANVLQECNSLGWRNDGYKYCVDRASGYRTVNIQRKASDDHKK